MRRIRPRGVDECERSCFARTVSRGELTREVIVAQAAEIADRLGLAGLTIGSLATRVNMSKSGLFAHFRSKESLQLQVLAYARERFLDDVARPALRAGRGEPRVRRLFERWLAHGLSRSAGCLFVSATTEYDDQPGAVRDQLVADHRDLMDAIAQMVRTGVAEGQFRADADPEQFAFDLHGVMLAFFYAYRLLGDPAAEARTRRAFEALLSTVRTPRPDPTGAGRAAPNPPGSDPAGADPPGSDPPGAGGAGAGTDVTPPAVGGIDG